MSPLRDHLRYVPFSRARFELNAADLLLFRPRPLKWWQWFMPRAWFGAMICVFGRSDYCHAATAVAVRGVWFAAETVEGHGGRLYPIRRYARDRSGSIDVYRPDPRKLHGFSHAGAADAALDIVGEPYGWRGVILSALLHLPIVRQLCWIFVDGQTDDDSVPTRPLYCSAAAAWAARTGGGCDPVVGLADGYTEPGDLARSPFYEYLLTITDDDDPRVAHYAAHDATTEQSEKTTD